MRWENMAVKTYDFEFQEGIDNPSIPISNVDDYDFKEKDTRDYHFLIKFHAINIYYSTEKMNMEKLLNDLGIVTRGSNMYCPFHNDEITGKPSAKYHPDSDMIYCFSESKIYTSYHVLKDLYGADMKKIFKEAWGSLPDYEKEELIRKYGDEDNIDKREFINPIWKELTHVVNQFMMGNVDFRKHKNALYKVMTMISESKIPKKRVEEDNGIMLL
jgi:hypothetical protein